MTAHDSPPKAQRVPPNKKGETGVMRAAFSIYAEMGADRSIDKVAKQIKRPHGTVQVWSKKFNWPKRVLDLQDEVNAKADESLKERLIESVIEKKKFKSDVLEGLRARFEDSQMIKGMRTLPRLSIYEMIQILNMIKTELGEPTTITKTMVPDDAKNPFASLAARLFPPKPNESKGDTEET